MKLLYVTTEIDGVPVGKGEWCSSRTAAHFIFSKQARVVLAAFANGTASTAAISCYEVPLPKGRVAMSQFINAPSLDGLSPVLLHDSRYAKDKPYDVRTWYARPS